MDSFEINKILGGFLFTCLVLLALNITAGAIFSTPTPEKPGYAIAVKESGEKKEAAPAETEVPLPTRLASATVEKGQATAKQCATCHTFDKGGPNRVGPNLWGVVGRPRASEAGFAYSDAMKAKGGTWTFEELDKFLDDPRSYIPGTKMTFAGLKRGTDRANVIAYLDTLSDNPVPLPKAAEAAPAPAKAAEAAKTPEPAKAPAAAPAAPAPAAPK